MALKHLLLSGIFLHYVHSNENSGTAMCTISRRVTGRGFHRTLETELEITSEQFNHNPNTRPEIALVENLPPQLYIDLYQVAMLEEFGGPKIYSRSDIDVEKASFDSTPFTVYVFSVPTITGALANASFSVPVHMRYNRPSDVTDSYQVALSRPTVLIRFEDGPWLGGMGGMMLAPSLNGTDVYWSRMHCVPATEDGSVKLSAPVGESQHTFLVVVGTISVTVGGTLCLISKMLKSGRKKED